MTQYSLNDPNNRINLIQTISGNGGILATFTLDMSEHLPNSEQVSLFEHIHKVQGDIVAAMPGSVLFTGSTVSTRFQILASDDTVLTDNNFDFDPAVPSADQTEYLHQVAIAVSSFAEAQPPAVDSAA